MDIHYPTIDEPATPDYVLAVIRDMHRQQSQFGDADPDVSLSFDTTINDWRWAFICDDLGGWRGIARETNQIWGIDISEAEWESVLRPSNEKRLADVCALIARHVHRPRIRPARWLGCDGDSAGTFLTIRSLLHLAGADVQQLAPSTPLDAHVRQYCEVFLGPVSRLAPGVLPLVRFQDHPVFVALTLGLVSGLAGMLVGLCTGFAWLGITGFVLLVVSYLLETIAGRWLRPRCVQFGELHTFRDLAVAVAEADQPD